MSTRTPAKKTRAQSTGRTAIQPSVTNVRSNTASAGRISSVSATTAAIGALPDLRGSDENTNILDDGAMPPVNVSTNTTAAAQSQQPTTSVNTASGSQAGLVSSVSLISAVPSAITELSGDISDSEHSDDEQTNNGSAPTMVLSRVPTTLNDVNAELELLRAQEQLLAARLRVQQLQQAMENSGASGPSASVVYRKRIKAADVEYLVPVFTGDDDYGIKKWIDDFEDVLKSLNGEPDDYYKMARHLIRETAKVYLRTIRVKNYAELKRALLQRYDRHISYYDVYEKLRNRYRRREESVLQYITSMQEIALRVEMDERELVSLIIAGLRDTSGYVSMLAGAETIDALVRLLPAYERNMSLTRFHAPGANTSGAAPKRMMMTSQQTSGTIQQSGLKQTSATSADANQVRCYNCSKFGHISSECPEPKRAPGSCFVCGQTDHVRANCPKRKRTVALVQQVDDSSGDHVADAENDALSRALGNMPMVSIAFECDVNKCTQAKSVHSLLDTGSPISFVCRSLLPIDVPLKQLLISDYCGAGDVPIYTYGKIDCYIKLYHRLKSVSLYVVPDNTFPVEILLGRDALQIFSIGLYFHKSRNSLKQNIFSITLNKNKTAVTTLATVPYSNINCNEFATVKSASMPNIEYNKIKDSSPLNEIYLCTSDLTDCITSVDMTSVNVVNNLPVTSDMATICLNDEITYDHFDITNSSHNEPASDFSIEHDCELDSIETNFELLFDIDPKLNLEIKSCIEECIFQEYVNIDHSVIKSPAYEMEIQLENQTPFYYHPRRLSYVEKSEVREMIQELLEKGIIKPSDSPYASPIVLVKKKNGDTRMCVDYRALNKLTVRDNFPLPLIEDCLEYLNNKKVFTLLDLKSGFHQVKISDASTKFTSFVTPEGQYEYLRMPFGLKNAPSVFQRFINKILKSFIDSGKIVVYIDDILLASENMDEHLALLSEVLRCIATNGLELQINKCQFAYSSIEYLGFVVSSEGIKPGTRKLEAVQKFPTPTSVKNVRSFLGLCSFFRRFIPGFAQCANPLYRLTHNEVPFDFDEKCIYSFETLKELLMSAPVLSIYDPTRETELHTDASKLGYGAVLLQRQTDNKFHPVAYFSKSVSDHEKNYHSYELETLAVVYALARFRVYLGGIRFTIVTDCNSLVQTFSRKEVNTRIARWVWEFERFNYVAKYRKGASMGHADALSRNPIVAIISSSDIGLQLQATQNRDPTIKRLKEVLESSESAPYEMHNGIIYRRNKLGRLLFYVPKEMEQQLIHHIHEKIGHFGSDKCYAQMKTNYWMPNLKEKIDVFISNCIKCILYSAPPKSTEHSLYSIPKKSVPFDTIHIDHFGPLPSVNSKQKHLLVIVDSFTKFVKVYPATSTSTKEVCRALEKYFEFYSRPSRIISDRGTCFTSTEFTEFIEKHNIQHIKNASASPQANGQVERINRILKNMLGKLTEPLQHSDWTKQIKHVEYAINNTLQKSIGTSPSQVLFGVKQKGPEVDYLTEYLEDQSVNDTERNLQQIRNLASAKIEKSQKYSQQWFEEHCKPAKSYSVGDFVVMHYVDTSIGNKKLVAKFRGPYIIHKVLSNDRYVLRDIENCQITQIPYNGIIEAKHLRLWKNVTSGTNSNAILT